MIRDIITLVVGNYFFTTFLLGLLAAWISLLRKPKPHTKNVKVEAFLSWYMLLPIGISNLINFVFHVFFGEMSARFIGWADSPFQREVGFASLGIGTAGVLAFRAGLPFRFATFIPRRSFRSGRQADTYTR